MAYIQERRINNKEAVPHIFPSESQPEDSKGGGKSP